jgi:hypothetical protein
MKSFLKMPPSKGPQVLDVRSSKGQFLLKCGSKNLEVWQV